jgi:hypothetical protein
MTYLAGSHVLRSWPGIWLNQTHISNKRSSTSRRRKTSPRPHTGLGIVAVMMVDEEMTAIGHLELQEAGPVPDTT